MNLIIYQLIMISGINRCGDIPPFKLLSPKRGCSSSYFFFMYVKHWFGLIGILVTHLAFAQAPQDFTLPVQTRIEQQPFRIRFQWPAQPQATGFYFYRKSLTDTAFTLLDSIKQNTSSLTEFMDQNVMPHTPYEYHIRASVSTSGLANRNIYIVTGSAIAPEHRKGSILILTDSTLWDSLQAPIQLLHRNLVREGWRVHHAQSLRSNNPRHAAWVKAKIQQQVVAVNQLNSVFIIGHIPVPYSGRINPDGHPDHLGAWPADGFYADLDSLWLDDTVNISVAARLANINVPGDGKYDPSFFFLNRLAVGRVDFSNLPVFATSETALYERYFQKNHAFRNSQSRFRKRALIDDNLPSFTEKFSQGAWKSFSTLVGMDSLTDVPSYETMATATNNNSYLFSYGAGSGSYTSANGIANSSDFLTKAHQTVFTQLIGSYFGDWDTQNNLMRCALAGIGAILTCHWGGRPQHFLHHMAIGKTIGYSTRVTMNNKGQYFPAGFSMGRVHQALMGDPSLQADYLLPQPKPTINFLTNNSYQVRWPHHPESGIQGYYVYRASTVLDSFQQLNHQLLTDTSFIDLQPLPGKNVYMIRAARLDTILTTTATLNHGSFWKLSPGGIDSAEVNTNPIPVQLIAFQAQRQSTCVDRLNWQVGDESNVRHYEVIWSVDGRVFTPFSPPKRISADNLPGRTYQVELPAITPFPLAYRLKIVDQDDTYRYSPIATVSQIAACIRTPSIVVVGRELRWQNMGSAPNTLQVYNQVGQLIYQTTLQQNHGQLSLANSLSRGWYSVKISRLDQRILQQQIWLNE